MKRVINIRSGERGSALLLTLGVMSLALIMAMAFAFSARTETRIAQVNSELVQARLLAETALNRAMANLSLGTPVFNSNASTPPATPGLPFFMHAGDKSAEPKNSLKHLVRTQSDPYVQWLYGTTPGSFWDNAGFHTILEKDETYAAGDRVSGRIAMVIWDESCKIDFNEIETMGAGSYIPWANYRDLYMSVSAGYDSTNKKHFQYSLGLPGGDPPMFNDYTQRIGQHIYELKGNALTSIIRNDWYTSQGVRVMGVQLYSYDHMLKRIADGVGNTNYSTFDIRDLSFYSAHEPEAYYVSGGGATPLVLHSRFDITGTEYAGYASWPEAGAAGYWKNITVEELASGETAEFNQKKMEENPSDIQYIAKTIPYLKNQKQVCANLKDYCDEDNDASVPDTPVFTVASLEPPEYCGNEKVLYFNEFNFIFKVVFAIPAADHIQCSLSVYPAVEMVKIFKEATHHGTVKLRLYGEAKYLGDGAEAEINKTPWSDNGGNQYLEWTIDSSKLAFDDENACGYRKVSCKDTGILLDVRDFTISGGGSDPLLNTEKQYYSFVIHKVVAVMEGSAAGKFYDISVLSKAEPLQKKEEGAIRFKLEMGGLTEKIFATTFEVQDPRCNLKLEDGWELTRKLSDGVILENLENKSGKNGNFLPGDGTGTDDKDREKSVDLTTETFSTAFIRNAPMKSFWELGAIHRGTPFQTINLTKFKAQNEMGTYADGDGAILDQVKFGPVKISQSKVNLNHSNLEVLQYLLDGINHQGYDDFIWRSIDWTPSTGNADVTLNFAQALTSKNRGEICNMIKNSEGTRNDRELEAYAGRTANLLSSRYNRYTVLAVGQSMSQFDDQMAALSNDTVFQNLVNAGKLLNPTRYTVNVTERKCSILATKMLLVQLLYDSWAKTFEIVRTMDLEE